jgi:ribosome-binding protein aMBF1 (putative translation factor)
MPATASPTVPYTMALPDGRNVYVELPEEMTGQDRDGSLTFKPAGVRRLDEIRAVATRDFAPPSPGFVQSARSALGLTQKQLAQKLGRSEITVKRWEGGTLRPGDEAMKGLRRLLSRAAKRGVVLG